MSYVALEDFFKNPSKTDFKISPDGKHISFLSSFQNRLNIHVSPLDNLGTINRITEVTNRNINTYFWASNSVILFLKDEDGDENFKLFSSNIENSTHKNLTPFEKVNIGIVDRLHHDPEHILISMNKRDKRYFDVYKINAETGVLDLVAENPGNISGWYTDHSGTIRLATVTDGVNSSLLYRSSNNSEFKTVLETNFKNQLDPLFFDFNNEMVYAASNLGRDKVAIVKMNPETGEELEMIFEHPEVDVQSLSFSRKRKVLLGISYVDWKIQKHFLDEEIGNIYKNIESKLAGKQVYLSHHDEEEQIYIVRTTDDKSMGEYYTYNVEQDDLFLLGKISPWINENDMASMKPIHYTSRDGLKINGYLTLPNNKEANNLPVVINPHGGPWYRDNWGYNPEVQFLANRGFAVLQMNFRGSTGYGRDFLTKAFKQWGKKMQDDISDGVKWLIDEGIADPKRIAIYGGSYGGYATLSGLTFTPELYACGVDYVGVSNLFTFLESIPPYWEPYREMMYEMVGHPEEDKALLESASPIFHVDKIKAPLFVAQGANDPRVKQNESDQIVEALRERGVHTEYMLKEDEGHGFHNEENRFDFYRAMESFLQKHIG